MLTRLVQLVTGSAVPSAARGGTSPTGSASARDAGSNDPGDQPAATPAGWLDEDATSILRQKILMAWLRNRHQLLFPHILHRVDQQTARLACEAAVVAAMADGASHQIVLERLQRLDHQLGARSELDAAADRMRPLGDVLAEVHNAETASVIYAACLLASDRRVHTSRLWLRYLAARLSLSDRLVESLEQRYATE